MTVRAAEVASQYIIYFPTEGKALQDVEATAQSSQISYKKKKKKKHRMYMERLRKHRGILQKDSWHFIINPLLM